MSRRTPLPALLIALACLLLPTSAGAAATGNGSAAASVAPNPVFGMGLNSSGQLGDGSTTSRAVPVPANGITDALQIAVGASSTAALRKDGTVWSWGASSYIPGGQLSGFVGTSAIAEGDDHVLAIRPDGTIILNGKDNHGQLGDGGDLPPDCGGCPDLPRPALIGGQSAVAVAGGYEFSLALRSNGTVIGWGRSDVGQVADGVNTTSDRLSITQIAGLTTVDAIAAGIFNGYALKHDGTVWSWGYNDRGQLGNGGAFGTVARSPVQVAGINNAVAVAGGAYHGLALLSTGQVLGWGGNTYGAVGDGSPNDTTVAHPVVGLTNVKAIAAGLSYSLALKNDGTLWGWGQNVAGRLRGGGDPSEIIRTPVQITGAAHGTLALGTGPVADQIELVGSQGPLLAAPNGLDFGEKIPVGSSTASRTITLTNDGFPVTPGAISLKGPDKDEFTITDDTCSSTPLAAGQSCTVTARFAPVAPGAATAELSVALPNGGSSTFPVSGYAAGGPNNVDLTSPPGIAFAWGAGTSGQLGNGASNNSKVQVPFGGAPDVVTVAAGTSHSVALRSDGTLWSAGSNASGQLGNGAPIGSQTPQPVSGLSGVEAIAAGANHTLALRSDGSVWAWGLNSTGQLGDGTKTNRSVPVRVRGLTNVIAIGAGLGHSIALRSDGSVWAWGDNAFGQLGNGTFDPRTLPGPVSALSGVVAITAGGYHNLALKSDGTAAAWGNGNQGELGIGTVGRRSTPVAVPGLTNVVSIAGGYLHSLVAKSDGSVWSFGDNSNGQLGNGNTTQLNSPTQVPGLSSVASVTAGYQFSLARKADRTAWGWGLNNAGQLGNGSAASQSLTPVWITNLNHGVGLLGAGPQASTGMVVGVPSVITSTAKLTFPNGPVGTPSAALTVTIANNGIAPLQFGSAAIVAGPGGGDADQFSISGDSCSQTAVPAGGSCVIGIRYKPLVSGTPVAFLRVPSNAVNGTALVTLDPPAEDSVPGTQPAAPSETPAQPATHGSPPPPIRAALASCKAGHLKHRRITMTCTFATRAKRAITSRVTRGRKVFASGRTKAHGTRVKLHLKLRSRTKPGLYTLSLSWKRGKVRAAAVQTVLIKR